MKSTYIQPQMIAVKLQNQSHLMEGSTFSSFDTNQTTNEEYIYFLGGSTTGSARVKEINLWDDEW